MPLSAFLRLTKYIRKIAPTPPSAPAETGKVTSLKMAAGKTRGVQATRSACQTRCFASQHCFWPTSLFMSKARSYSPYCPARDVKESTPFPPNPTRNSSSGIFRGRNGFGPNGLSNQPLSLQTNEKEELKECEKERNTRGR